jgi:nitrate/nitrite transporter NarK
MVSLSGMQFFDAPGDRRDAMTLGGVADGRRGWAMWALPAFLFFIAFFHRSAPGILAKDLMRDFNTTGAIVGLLSATYFYAYAGLMIPAGLFVDAFGARRVVSAGGLVMGLGTVAMGLAATPRALFAGRFAVGLGAAVTFVGALKVAATWFPSGRFGFLAAVTATVGFAGALVSTAPLAVLVAIAGWRRALGIVSLVTLAATALCFAFVRDRPDGRAADAAPGARAVLVGTVAVLGNPHTWPPFLVFFCLYSAFGNLSLWIVPYLRDVYGLSARAAALYAAAPWLALLASAPLTGFVSDRVLGRRKLPYVVLASCYFALWLVLLATLGVLPLAGVSALLFAMGALGGAFVLTWPLGREVNPPQLAGIAVAVVNLGGFLGAALTQGPLGAVLDARWAGAVSGGTRVYPLEAYAGAFLACAALALAAALLSLLLRETRGRNVYHELRGGE